MDTRSLQFIHHRLDTLRRRHLYRQLRTVSDGSEAWMTLEGQRVLNLSSNNYLGLASHPVLCSAARDAALEESCSAGSSRLIAGSSVQHQELEARFACFKQSESALLFNSGYAANVGVIAAMAEAGDLILSDELNHASIIDGCRLSKAECKIYAHGNVSALEVLLVGAIQAGHRGKIIVVTDTVFSMDGDLAPIEEIAHLCNRYDAILLVDEAHATGCIGPGGRGLLAACDIRYEATIAICTLSKALGSFGAIMAGPALVKEYLVNVSRHLIFTTALPPTVIAASLASINLLEQTPSLVEDLQANATFFRQGLQALGFNTLASSTQIVPVLIADDALTLEMAAELLRQGIFAAAIRSPTVPRGTSRIRTSVMATHSRADLNYALEAFERVGKRLGII